jgi:murein DD-endopeptidase MepM/ murein hydrolase activator NlpD
VTLYGHNTSVAVSCNENVSQGQVVSYSGCTGFCTGPHVHFEVRVHGAPVDPLGYLP